MSKARDMVETLRTVLVDGDVTNANFTGADLDIAKGGTGASSAGAARTSLGLAIGSDVQAYNSAIMVDGDIGTTVQAHDADTAKLDANANFTGTLQRSGTNVLVVGDVTNANFTGADLEIGKGGTGASSAGAARTNLDVDQAGTNLAKSGGAMTGAITTNSTFDGRDVAADGVLATNAMPKAGGAFSGAVTTNSTIDGRDVAADGVLATNALPKAGGTVTGLINHSDQILQRTVLKDYGETKVAMAAHAVDLELGNVFTYTLSGGQTVTFSNPPASGTAGSFTMIVTNGGSATLTWPTSVDWPAATAPALTASGVDLIFFTTIDGGSIWYGTAVLAMG